MQKSADPGRRAQLLSYVASKILSQGAHPKSPIQNPKSKIPKIQNPKSPKSKIPKFQNPNFAHKDLLHNVPKTKIPKIQNPQNPKIQNPQNPKSPKSKIQNPQILKSKLQNPNSKIQNPQNPKSPKSKIQASLAGFWRFGDLGFWILGILDFGFGIPAPKSKIQTPQNPKSKIQNPQNPKSKILRRNPKFGALGASRKELLPNDTKS